VTSEFVVTGATVFDGERALPPSDVHVRGGIVVSVGRPVRLDLPRVDGRGGTLLPGLIDSHTHSSSDDATSLAITFGVTTELDMNSRPVLMDPVRHRSRTRDDVADIRSSSMGVTVSGGHPTQYMAPDQLVGFPFVDSPEAAAPFVAARAAEGADYIKIFIEDGSALWDEAHPSLPTATIRAVTEAAHEHGLIAVAHATGMAAARRAVESGVDGLVHCFVDQPATDEVVDLLAVSGTFVVATLCTLGSLLGERSGVDLADDPRVVPWVSEAWRANLREACPPTPKPSELAFALETVRRLHVAGVPVLTGSDASRPVIGPGTAHGATIHSELGLLVRAGLTATEALAAATSVPADRFGLTDRGRIVAGRQADLLLVDGDPTTDIDATLSIRSVWRRGSLLDRTRPA
jgi:imidazolonepropionase-like amidohydrolase